MAVASEQSETKQCQASGRDLIAVDVHALHKSATMFLFQFFGDLAKRKNLSFHSENNAPPNSARPKLVDLTQRDGYVRCPLRTFEVEEMGTSSGNQEASAYQQSEPEPFRIFHVRDPRDILVSEYFSIGWIHPTDDTPIDQRRQVVQQMGIDEYVLTISRDTSWPLESKLQPLVERELDPRREMIVTYEQMVTSFHDWVTCVIQPFGFRFPKITSARLAWRYRNEFKAPAESLAHKRRITPGDHREKLKPETIKQLNERFEIPLKRFGYLD